jgi:hypothetical protein
MLRGLTWILIGSAVSLYLTGNLFAHRKVEQLQKDLEERNSYITKLQTVNTSCLDVVLTCSKTLVLEKEHTAQVSNNWEVYMSEQKKARRHSGTPSKKHKTAMIVALEATDGVSTSTDPSSPESHTDK